MTNRLGLKTIIIGGLLLILLASGFYFQSGSPILAQSSSQFMDSTRVDQLSRAYYETHPAPLVGPGDPNGTLAAVLAAELLLTPINYSLHLPMIVK